MACTRLLARFEGPEEIFSATLTELKAAGVREDAARNIKARVFRADPETEWRRAGRCGARILSLGDPGYPALLREIHDPPVILYARGRDLPAGGRFISVVGSRSATRYGIRVAERIGRELGRSGIGVVSGLALGVDSAAHRGCLAGRGFTVAVLGTGIDVAYPRSNRPLFREIEKHGLILSEFPLGTAPEPWNFPVRNRIISGISRGVVVVEAARKSGSLITASQALEQGREVFAVPGSIDSAKSGGTHFLIKQGAKLVEGVKDILEELHPSEGPYEGMEVSEDGTLAGLDEDERRIFQIVGPYPQQMDEIVRASGMEAGRVAGLLLRLELKGRVTQLAGNRFVR